MIRTEHVGDEKEITIFRPQNPARRGHFTDTGVNRRIIVKK
jgi:hypothetical protein